MSMSNECRKNYDRYMCLLQLKCSISLICECEKSADVDFYVDFANYWLNELGDSCKRDIKGDGGVKSNEK